MTDETIFKSDDPQTDVAEPKDQTGEAEKGAKQEEAPSFQIPAEAEDFIGEGKKYKSLEDALSSLPHKETFIEQLKRENEELRNKMQESKTVDDLLERINQPEQKPAQEAQQEQQPQEKLSQEDIASIIDSRISEREQLNDTAAKSPNAVFSLFGIGKKEGKQPSKLTSSYNSGAIQQPPKAERKPIMWGASTGDMLNSWRSAAPE